MTDVNLRRAEVLAEVSTRVTLDAIPAPHTITADTDGLLAMDFDSAEHVEAWAAFLDWPHEEGTYTPLATGKPTRLVKASGEWRGWNVHLAGWTKVERAEVPQDSADPPAVVAMWEHPSGAIVLDVD